MLAARGSLAGGHDVGTPRNLATVRMGRIWNLIRIEYQIEYRRNFEHESNIGSNKNIQWLQIRLE